MTLLDVFAAQVERRGERPALRHKVGGRWRALSWDEWSRAAREVAAGLSALGVQPGDRVGLVSSTGYRWAVADIGILVAGAVTVPVYPTAVPEMMGFVLADAGARTVVVEDPLLLARFGSARAHEAGPPPEHIIVLETAISLPEPDAEGRTRLSIEDVVDDSWRSSVLTWEELLERGRARLREAPSEIEDRRRQVNGSSVATLVYTLGTTGDPKGVVLTHENLAASSSALRRVVPLGVTDEQLLFLPLAHILGRLTIVTQLQVGFTTSFAEGPSRVLANCSEVRPTFLVSVPRFYERLRSEIMAQLRGDGDLRDRLGGWALGVGREVARRRRRGTEPRGLLALQARAAQRWLFKPIHERLGGRLRFLVSGGAPLDRDVAELLTTVGLPVLEGYGLTECAGAVTVNVPDAFRLGSVGRPLPGIELRVADDGEILLRGPGVMQGYHGHPDETARVLDAEGWLYTGDVGRQDDEGFVYLTDRKKDLLRTTGGQPIPPQKIERMLEHGDLIQRAVVVGDRRPYAAALIVPEVEALTGWAEEQGLSGDPETLLGHPRILARLQQDVDDVNRRLPPHERVRRFALLSEDLSQERGELTATMELRRRVVRERYGSAIDGLYAS